MSNKKFVFLGILAIILVSGCVGPANDDTQTLSTGAKTGQNRQTPNILTENILPSDSDAVRFGGLDLKWNSDGSKIILWDSDPNEKSIVIILNSKTGSVLKNVSIRGEIESISTDATKIFIKRGAERYLANIDGTSEIKLDQENYAIEYFCWDGANKKVAVGYGIAIAIFSTDTGAKLGTINKQILAKSCADDGKKVIGPADWNDDGTSFRISEIFTGAQLRELGSSDPMISKMEKYSRTNIDFIWSSDGKRVAFWSYNLSDYKNHFFIFDPFDSTEIGDMVFQYRENTIWMPDTRKILTYKVETRYTNIAEDLKKGSALYEFSKTGVGIVQVWNIESGAKLMETETLPGSKIALSPDGKKLAILVGTAIQIVDADV